MPPSRAILTNSSAPVWSTPLRALKSPLPSPNVRVPKQSFETRSPVLPSVEYSKMPPQLLPILALHLNARHSCNCGPHSTVKGAPMLISEFARVTGLTRDTVRFYARLGLLQPKTNGKGGRHPYNVFTEKDIQAAEVIRISQSLGMSLKEIAAFNEERRKGHLTNKRRVEIMSAQLVSLEAKATELEVTISYLRAKIDYLKSGQQGPEPDFENYARLNSRVKVDNNDKPLRTLS